MTVEPSLHKERVDFAHNYTKIRLKCPECIRITKGVNHVRVYDNIPGLWRHIRQEHGEIFNLQLTTDRIKEVLKNIALAIDWRMLPDYDKPVDTTTSLSILYNGKKPRRDVLNNLGEIANLLKMQSELYPFFKTKLLIRLIEDKIGNRDARTMKNYFDCVTKYSVKNMQNGTYDVSDFGEKFYKLSESEITHG